MARGNKMQHNKYGPLQLEEIAQIFRAHYLRNVKYPLEINDKSIIRYSRSDYEAVRKLISKYSNLGKSDFMWEYILDVLFIIEYESLPLWINRGDLAGKLASWRIKYGS